MPEPIRLSKCVVALTGCSRREAELYIEGGWVTVDGQVVEEPQFKVAGEQVALLPDARPDEIEPVTLLLHKPIGYDSDQGDRPAWKLLSADTRVVEPAEPPQRCLRRHFMRLRVPMPLASQASGLLVLTQDYAVFRKLTEDFATIEQEYVVEVEGQMAPDGLSRLNDGTAVPGLRLAACKVSWQSERRLRFAAKGIQAEHIETLCEAVGLRASLIRRLRIGQVSMSKLQPGQWRYLPSFKRF